MSSSLAFVAPYAKPPGERDATTLKCRNSLFLLTVSESHAERKDLRFGPIISSHAPSGSEALRRTINAALFTRIPDLPAQVAARQVVWLQLTREGPLIRTNVTALSANVRRDRLTASRTRARGPRGLSLTASVIPSRCQTAPISAR